MSEFDLAGFRRAEFEPRQDQVDVSDSVLAQFFPDDQPKIWTVRGLEGEELQRCLDAKTKQQDVTSILKAVAENKDMAEKLRTAASTADKQTPAELVKRLELLLLGSVEPKLERPDAVKIARIAPIEFIILSARISELTGEGFDLVKPEAASEATAA